MPRAVRPRAKPEPDWRLAQVTALAGLCASVAGVLLVLMMPGHWPALLGALLIACVPPGAAIMCWVDSGFGIVQAGLTLTLSLAVTAITSASMIWLTAWHPKVLLVVALASAVSCAACLWQRGTPHVSRIWITGAHGAGLWRRLAPLVVGLAAWAYGVSRTHAGSIGPYGVLASASVWFYLGVATVLGGTLAELLRRTPRSWLVSAYIGALVVLIYATVPILFGAPEYGWVYKHVDLILGFGQYGRVTDPSNIYQQWPAFFTTGASVCGLAGVGPFDLATWAPLAFELADALLLLGIFRMLAMTRRSAYLALLLYEGFIAWVGQDYLSPQAFAFTLWLGIASIILRWLLMPEYNVGRLGVVMRVRARLLAQLPVSLPATHGQRRAAVALIAVMYSAIVAAHQLTPYMVLLGVSTLAVLGLLWRGWFLLTILGIMAVGFLAPRYGLIVSQFGGLFGHGSAVGNASGVKVSGQGAQVFTARFVHILAVAMWSLALGAVVRHWRGLGQVAVPALWAFSPFVVLLLQSYGGEAVYRVYMFSSPWCALLIADTVMEFRATAWRSLLVICACTGALVAGLQGSYGVASVDAITTQELSASQWLYSHAPQGSLFVMPADNFPTVNTEGFPVIGTYHLLNKRTVPADPQIGNAWLNEGNLAGVEKWMAFYGQNNAYVLFSRSMDAYANYYDVPYGYYKLKRQVSHAIGWSVVYRNADATIYQVHMNEYGM